MTTLKTDITAVTVFPNRARVTRDGMLHLARGEHMLVLAELPASLDKDSVRASGKGANAKILGVEVATEFVARPPETSIAELQRALEVLQDADKSLGDDDTTQVARIEFLKSLREASGQSLAKGIAFGKATLENVESLAAYLDRELDAANTRRREIAQKRREQKREIEAAQARLNQAQTVEQKERREIRVTVEATAETDLQMEVTYAVAGASWTPLYDVRLNETKVELTYLASVSQQTGEDWNAVELALSTARPAVSAEIPELDPWYVDGYRPAPMMASATARGSAAGGMFQAAPAPQSAVFDAAPLMEVAQASVESSGAAVTYRVARPMTIPSDGAPHKTTVTTLDLTAQLDYVTAPKIAEEAYLRAKIKNESPFILLLGSANIFHGADFVGATELETVAPNEEFEAHLGVDDRVKIERELIEHTVDKTLIGNTRRLFFGYKITLTNLLATPAKITALDQLPVSRDEEIKVKLRDTSPKPAEQSDLNVLKWELELKPQEKREITFAFAVEHPRAMRLRGITD